jgi:hypothetical protein
MTAKKKPLRACEIKATGAAKRAERARKAKKARKKVGAKGSGARARKKRAQGGAVSQPAPPETGPVGKRPRTQLSLLTGEDELVLGSDECYTPASILTPHEELLGGIDTDPCWSPSSLVRPRLHGYTITDDGLSQVWEGTVWLQPPYSDPFPWLEALDEYASSTKNRCAALLKLDPSTRWWAKTLGASAMGLWPYRLQFIGGYAGGKPAPFPSVSLFWNVPIEECARVLPRLNWYAQHREPAADVVGSAYALDSPSG